MHIRYEARLFVARFKLQLVADLGSTVFPLEISDKGTLEVIYLDEE